MTRFNSPISEENVQRAMPHVRDRRVAVDVSVLLAGLLDVGSYSNDCLSLLDRSTILLGQHVEDMALRVLRANSPNLVGDFADGLIQLSRHSTLERVSQADAPDLPEWVDRLSGEDRQVLAEAVVGGAEVLLTHDARFFLGRMPGVEIDSPSSFIWYYEDPRNVEIDPFAWTFLGLFWPNWGSEMVKGVDRRFYVLDLVGKAECFYETRSGSFILKWQNDTGPGGRLALPQDLEPMSTNFVAIAADETGIFLLVNEETRERATRIDPVPSGSRIYPFNNSRGGGQINGGMRFRMAAGRLREKRIRRLCRSRSLRLSDGELRFYELVSTTRARMERRGLSL